MEEQFLNEILKDTFTLESFKTRYQVLKRKLEASIYTSEDKTAEVDSQKLQEQWIEKFDKDLLSKINNDQFSNIKAYIDTFLNSNNLLSVYFVFIPGDAQIKELGGWLRKNLRNPKLIFDVKVDPSLIGGCAIVYKGVYRDYSLRARIGANKDKLIEEFRKYFKQ